MVSDRMKERELGERERENERKKEREREREREREALIMYRSTKMKDRVKLEERDQDYE